MRVDVAAPRPRRRWRRILVRAGAVGLVALIAWSFPFGPLFPWSPWKPGYAHLALSRADVFYPAATPLPDTFRQIDRYIEEAEAFHGLAVRSRIRVILCGSWSQFTRLLPHMRGRGVGAAVLDTGTVIYVTPRLGERGFDHGEFLRHELSHATLHQNQTLWQAFRMSRAESFFEGLAVSFGRQKAFVPTSEALAFVQDHDLAPVFDPAGGQDGRPRSMRLNYQVWRFFVEYLRKTGGRDRFQALLRQTMSDPEGYAKHVEHIYGLTLAAAQKRFQESVRAGTWTPSDT